MTRASLGRIDGSLDRLSLPRNPVLLSLGRITRRIHLHRTIVAVKGCKVVDRDLKASHEIILGRCPLPGSIWAFNDPQSLLHEMRVVVEEAIIQDTGRLWVRFVWENERRNTLPVDRFLQSFIPGL